MKGVARTEFVSLTVAEDQDALGHTTCPLKQTPSFRRTWVLGMRSSIGRRFALATISCSTLLAFFMTIAQLAADYRNEQRIQAVTLSKIETSILPALAESLWLLDETLIKSQIFGIAQIDGVSSVEIIGSEETYRVTNAPQATNHRVLLPIFYTSNGAQEKLGTLVVNASYVYIRNRVLNRALLILTTNFMKTICITVFFLYLFQRLIGQNISKLADFARTYDPEATGQRVKLAQTDIFGTHDDNCEFLGLEQSINQWSRATENYVEQLLQANKEQAEFTYAISHDLKSPTNTMAMLIEELQEEGAVGEGGNQILNDMRETNTRMGNLVVDVLDYSRLIGMQPEFTFVDVNLLIRNIEKDLSADIKASNAIIEYGDLPDIKGHPTQIRMMFQNLIANAIKFRRPDQAPTIRITATDIEDGVVFEVADNGIGIPAKHRESVFGLFTKLHSSATYDGSGLGLAISRRVMLNHGGTISIDASVEVGTTFKLEFQGGLSDEANQTCHSD